MKLINTYAVVALLFLATRSPTGRPFLSGGEPDYSSGETPNLSGQAYHCEIERTKEKEVRVSLESAFGKVFIEKGLPDKILVADFQRGHDSKKGVEISYKIKQNVGHLVLKPGEWDKHRENITLKNLEVSGLESGAWYLKFTDSVPLAFDIGLGVGEGDFDFTGLLVNELKMEAGASKIKVYFDEPNRSEIDHMKIESGVSRFTGYSLGNANFRTLSFSGGVGAYTLDFGGELRKEVNVNIEVGLGTVMLILPPEVGARIIAEETWLSRVDIPRDFTQRGSDEYVSDNYNTAEGRMRINVEAGLGSVKIKRSR